MVEVRRPPHVDHLLLAYVVHWYVVHPLSPHARKLKLFLPKNKLDSFVNRSLSMYDISYGRRRKSGGCTRRGSGVSARCDYSVICQQRCRLLAGLRHWRWTYFEKWPTFHPLPLAHPKREERRKRKQRRRQQKQQKRESPKKISGNNNNNNKNKNRKNNRRLPSRRNLLASVKQDPLYRRESKPSSPDADDPWRLCIESAQSRRRMLGAYGRMGVGI